MKTSGAAVSVPDTLGAGKAADVESYLAACPEPHRSTLEKLRLTIRSVVPKETTEAISYGMPSFRFMAHWSAMPLLSNTAAFSP